MSTPSTSVPPLHVHTEDGSAHVHPHPHPQHADASQQHGSGTSLTDGDGRSLLHSQSPTDAQQQQYQHQQQHWHQHPQPFRERQHHHQPYLQPYRQTDDEQTSDYAPVPQQQQQQQQRHSSPFVFSNGAAAAAAPASAVSASAAVAAQPAPSTPFHSYPHIQFRLPASFVELSAAMFQSGGGQATEAQATQLPTPPPAVPAAAPLCEPSSPKYAHVPVPSLASAPFQSLLTSAATGSGSAPRSSASPCASAHSAAPTSAATSSASLSSCYHVSFRAMHRADIGAVAALHDHLFPVKYDARFYFDLLLSDRITLLAFLEFDPRLMPQQLDHTSDGVTAAAAECPAILHEPLLIGVATGRCREQSGTCRRHMSGYVTTLGVDRRFRRIGLGKFLLKHIIRLIREHDSRCESIFLHVKEGNDAAVAMYRSCGFTLWERKFDHYHIEGRDYNALQMIKRINKKTSIYDEMEQEARDWCSVM